MTRVILKGHAKWNGEELDFKIGPWSGGIGLMVRRSDSETSTETGAGIWPTREKAQAIAEETAKRLLDPDCSVVWTEIGDL